ncbi:MAG: P1 family peptidase [Actinomycetota bacterium]
MATDAPLLPHQCERLAQRAGLGIARVGGAGGHSSGDLFLAFSTGNRGRLASYKLGGSAAPIEVAMLPDVDLAAVLGHDRGDRGGDAERARRGGDAGPGATGSRRTRSTTAGSST